MDEPNDKQAQRADPAREDAAPAPAPQGRPPSTRQQADAIGQLPRDELLAYAEELGLDRPRNIDADALVEEIEHRRRLIESLPHKTLLEIAIWARRPVKESATKNELVGQISRLEQMKFAGLSTEALRVLGILRGCDVEPDDDRHKLRRKIKKKEGFFRKLRRKRRALFARLIAGMVGDRRDDYRFLPEEQRPLSLKERIEDEGIVGGLSGRLRGAADDYVRDKLDEIEARIDRKLDEIDRRLAEWRDREIANRMKIIRITLFASVIVALLSLGYTLVKTKFPGLLP